MKIKPTIFGNVTAACGDVIRVICVRGRSRPASSRWYQSAGGRARSVSVVSQAHLGGGAIVQLPCTGHPTHSTPADYGTGTDTDLYVVWSCPGSTTAMLCSTALPATASRSCSEYRTMQLGSFSKHQDDPTLARCWGCYTGCPFSRGSSTKWLCWHSKSAAPLRLRTCDS